MEVVAAVELVGVFIVTESGRILFAKGDNLNLGGINALLHKEGLDSLGAALAESLVVGFGAALVAVAFNHDGDLVLFLQHMGLVLEQALVFRLDDCAVEVEADGFRKGADFGCLQVLFLRHVGHGFLAAASEAEAAENEDGNGGERVETFHNTLLMPKLGDFWQKLFIR